MSRNQGDVRSQAYDATGQRVLLLETAHVLGWEKDAVTRRIAKKLVDHSLASGWDAINGGFYDAGRQEGDSIVIINDQRQRPLLIERGPKGHAFVVENPLNRGRADSKLARDAVSALSLLIALHDAGGE